MSTLPIGTVTFFFTDIEGSTTRWEQYGQAMHHALARHDAILRQIIEAHGGHIFKTVGDAVYAAFSRAPDALAAAIAAQQSLQSEDWETIAGLPVRIALHSGIADERNGDYFGPTINRTARILAAGHGGQILLSAATYELIRDYLPMDASLRDLGEHRLKDLRQPEHIFQVVDRDVPSSFPPLRTLESHPNNLPIQRSPLLGREAEVAALITLLRRPDVGLVTLTGPGGTGKTRLALQVAADLLDDFPDGVWFVDLAPIKDPTLIPGTIGQAFGLQEELNTSLEHILVMFLAQKRLLLLLDNFEQVVEGAVHVGKLLGTARDVKVLVTSRIPLHLSGEHEFPVPPLALPDIQRQVASDKLTQYAAVALFIERAKAVKPDFQVTNATAPAIAEICVRLDGLPLAIELAAARIKVFPPDLLLKRLSGRLRLLTGGPRDLPARQQALRNTIDWSYALLDAPAQRLFARIGVFVGGCTLEAVEVICLDETLAVDHVEALASLVDQSLLRSTEDTSGGLRFVMLETIRDYSLERLAEQGDTNAIRSRHAAYYSALLEPTKVSSLKSERIRFRRLKLELDNVRAAMEWVLAHGDAQTSLRIANNMAGFCDASGHVTEGWHWIEAALEKSSANPNSEALSDAEARLRARALVLATLLATRQGDARKAQVFAEEGLALYQALGDTPGIVYMLQSLAAIANETGDDATARHLRAQALASLHGVNDSEARIPLLNDIGWQAYLANDREGAMRLLEEAVNLTRETGNPIVRSFTLNSLGMVVLEQGDYSRAQVLLSESTRLAFEVGAGTILMYDLQAFAWLATPAYAARGQAQAGARRAARIFGAVEALSDVFDSPFTPREQLVHLRHLAQARAQLDETEWAAAWDEGRAMTLEQVVAYALDERGLLDV